MRRLIAIAIALLIILPVVSPLMALGRADDPGRPACCRKDGKHRCMLMDADESSEANLHSATRVAAATLSERCPYGSRSVPRTSHPECFIPVGEAIFAGIVAHPSTAPQTESKRRISADRTRQKRGPPTNSLA